MIEDSNDQKGNMVSQIFHKAYIIPTQPECIIKTVRKHVISFPSSFAVSKKKTLCQQGLFSTCQKTADDDGRCEIVFVQNISHCTGECRAF